MIDPEPLLENNRRAKRLTDFLGLSKVACRSGPARVAESLDYEPFQSKVYFNRLSEHPPEKRHIYGYTGHTFGKFFITLVTGLVTGVLGVALAGATEKLLHAKNNFVETIVTQHGLSDPLWRAFGAQAIFTIGCVMVATILVQYWAPTAGGAGVSLVMAYLNGNDVPELLQLRALVVKWVGTALGCASGLAVGPEGPMVHLGACVASVISSLQYALWRQAYELMDCCPRDMGSWLAFFGLGRRRSRNDGPQLRPLTLPATDVERSYAKDVEKAKGDGDKAGEEVCDGLVSNADLREFVSAGAAAGIAAAFGAPIGGVLFSMEEACSHWSRRVAWRCFVCAAVATFTIAQLHPRWQSGMLSFAHNAKSIDNGEWLMQLPFIVIVSLAAGLLGAVFNLLRKWLWPLRASRKRHALRLLEALGAALACIVLMYSLSAGVGQCMSFPDEWRGTGYGLQFNCQEGQYNDLATAFLSSPGDTIRMVFSLATDDNDVAGHSCGKNQDCYFSVRSLGVLSVTYLLMMAMSSGLAVPGGLFMPSIMVGASIGAMSGLLLLEHVPESWNIQPGLYAIVAASAMLGGVFRASISLVVIVVEGTRGINFLFGIIIAVVVSNWIANLIHHEGVYESELERDGNVFFLRAEPPHALRVKTAEQIMMSPVIGFNEIESVERVVQVLNSTLHNGFPVYINEPPPALRDGCSQCYPPGGLAEGMILRNQLLVLLNSGAFCDEQGHYINRGASSADEFEVQLENRMLLADRSRRAKQFLSLTGRQQSDSLSVMENALSTLPSQLTPTSSDSANGFPSDLSNGNGHCAVNGIPGKQEVEAAGMNGWKAAGMQGRYLNLRPFMNQAPLTVRAETSADRVHQLFVSLGLRHLCVVNSRNRVVGMITRKDLDRAAGRGSWRKTRMAPKPIKDAPGLAEWWRPRRRGPSLSGDPERDWGKAMGVSRWWPLSRQGSNSTSPWGRGQVVPRVWGSSPWGFRRFWSSSSQGVDALRHAKSAPLHANSAPIHADSLAALDCADHLLVPAVESHTGGPASHTPDMLHIHVPLDCEVSCAQVPDGRVVRVSFDRSSRAAYWRSDLGLEEARVDGGIDVMNGLVEFPASEEPDTSEGPDVESSSDGEVIY